MIETPKTEEVLAGISHTKAQKRLIPVIAGILLILGVITTAVYLSKNKSKDTGVKSPSTSAKPAANNQPLPQKIEINKTVAEDATMTRKAYSYVRNYPSKTELKDEELVVVEVETKFTSATGAPAGSLDYKLVVDDTNVVSALTKPEEVIDVSKYGYQFLPTVFLNKAMPSSKGVVVFKIPKAAKKLTLRHPQLAVINAKGQTLTPAKNYDLAL
jgi:hypothetical protein